MTDQDSGETKDERYKRQTTEQFAALGRFVQAFDFMVSAVRFGLIQLYTRGSGRDSAKRQRIINIMLHHDVMTAKPLFDIFRAGIATVLFDDEYPIIPAEREATLSILKQVNTAYVALANRRNEFVHGSWHIGWTSTNQEDFSKINFHKFKTTKTGLAAADPLVDIADLGNLISECDRLKCLIETLTLCLMMEIDNRPSVFAGGKKVTASFRLEGETWTGGIKET